MIDFYQQEAFNDYQKVGYGSLKNMAVLKILKGRGIKAATADLAKTIFDESAQHGFSESLFTSADYLRYHYTRVEMNEKKKIFLQKLTSKPSMLFTRKRKLNCS